MATALFLATTACGSSTRGSSATTPGTTVGATAPDTTPSSTVAPVAAGWQPIDPQLVTGIAAFPCCASNYYGTPSPALPESGLDLADGSYSVSMQWGDDPAAPLQLVIHRFEQCGLLPADACEHPGDAFPPDEMGIDVSTELVLTVALDDHLRVILFGFRGFNAAPGSPSGVAVGNGVDLAELTVAVDSAYASLLAAPLAAGSDPNDIVADLAAHPAGGFGPGLDDSEYSLSFTFGDAPPLLFQGPFKQDETGSMIAGRGVDVLGVPSIDVVLGQITLYVYAGFYS